MDEPIDSKLISVVIQGEATQLLLSECVRLLRQNFPDAEIILSTWVGSEIPEIDVDKVVLSVDPGAFCADEIVGTLNNVNRQLVSTKAGLNVATRSYILKTRTDILVQSSKFLSYFGKYDSATSHYFQNRLLICNYYTRNPRVFKTCFHPSDWLVFGKAEDVRKYYEEIPLMTQEEGEWFQNHQKKSTFFTNYVCRFTPEQHIFLGFLCQNSPPRCTCYYDYNSKLVAETEYAFAECFVILDYQKQLQINFPKYNPNRYMEKHTTLSHWQWKALYKHYCQNGKPLLWKIYCLYGVVWGWISYARTLVVRILNNFGIKENVKRALSRGRKV